MKSKPIIPRSLAEQDVDEALNHYISEEAEQAEDEDLTHRK